MEGLSPSGRVRASDQNFAKIGAVTCAKPRAVSTLITSDFRVAGAENIVDIGDDSVHESSSHITHHTAQRITSSTAAERSVRREGHTNALHCIALHCIALHCGCSYPNQ
jgi:hypothetical protein